MRRFNDNANITAAILALLCLALMPKLLRAQDVDPPVVGQTNDGKQSIQSVPSQQVGTPIKFTVDPDPADSTEPYIHWRTHTGAATDCVASVRLQAAPGAAYEDVSALVIRCDGFVLVPRSAYDKVRQGATADVIVTGAEGESVVAPIPIAGWDRNVVEDHRVDYALLKVNGHHIRSLRLLSAYSVQTGDLVKIVYAVPTVTSQSAVCKSVTLTATVGQSYDHGARFGLESLKDPAGNTTSGLVPAGATVVDSDTGAALGMVTANGRPPSFSTFLHFNYIFDEVGLAPDRNALKALDASRTAPGGQPSAGGGGVRHVPGGPLTLQGTARAAFVRNYGTDIVCTPDFEIDTVPVTNGEFRAWMQLPRVHARAPNGWSLDEEKSPIRRQDLPVTGVTGDEASDYLMSREMRLPTEVEWQRASKVNDLTWLDTLWHRWTSLRDLCLSWRLDFLKFWEAIVAQDRAAAAQVSGEPSMPANPASDQSPLQLQHSLERGTIELDASIGNLLQNGFIGRFINPVRQYQEDVSVYGVADVVLNAPEMTLARGAHVNYGYKPLADSVDPYVSWTKYYRSGGTAFDPSSNGPAPIEDDLYYYEIGPHDLPAYYFLPILAFVGAGYDHISASGSGAPESQSPPRGRNKIRIPATKIGGQTSTREMSFQWEGSTGAEFRGAR